MARKPNYQMDRMERDRAKAAKIAAKDAARDATRQAERERSARDRPAGDEPRKGEE